jgi:hypothetical protein
LFAYDRTAVPDVCDINVGLRQNAYDGARATFVSYDPSSVLLHESVFSVVTTLSYGYLHAVREVLGRCNEIVKVVPQKLRAPLTTMPVKNSEKLNLFV